jgi:hypothetical protein
MMHLNDMTEMDFDEENEQSSCTLGAKIRQAPAE